MEVNGFMLKLKRLALASFCLMSSSIIFANELTADAEWSFGAKALYLQPSFGGNGLSYSSFSNYSGKDDNGVFVGKNGGTNHINNINPKWHFGFELEGAYRFNPKNDVNIEWYHLQEHVNGHLPIGSVFSGSFDGFYANHLKLAQSWDAINLELGHRMHCDENKSIRLHAGLAYARIKNKFTNYPQLFPTRDVLFVTHDTMSYHGIGPRIGGDFGYTLWHGLGLYAKAAGDLLVGSTKQHISGFQNVPSPIYGLQPYGTPNYSHSHNGVIVTELEAKLGVKYDYPITQDNVLSFDLGYLWLTYLNAITSYTDIGIVGTADGASIGTNTNANFSLNGFYFGVNLSV